MSAITKLLNVKVEERSDAIRLQFVFNDNKWHALEMYKPVDVEELGKQLIKLGQTIVHDAKLSEREENDSRQT